MIEINGRREYNGGSFQCYFSKAESLDAIFLNSGSFNGIDPIFPISFCVIFYLYTKIV